jgi:hypothetical protein
MFVLRIQLERESQKCQRAPLISKLGTQGAELSENVRPVGKALGRLGHQTPGFEKTALEPQCLRPNDEPLSHLWVQSTPLFRHTFGLENMPLGTKHPSQFSKAPRLVR